MPEMLDKRAVSGRSDAQARKLEAMALGSLHRQTLADQLYSILEARILSGELAPGSHMSEEGLASSYGVSRAPVREALAELERSGFAARLGPRDRVVMIPTAEMIRQRYDLWWIIDAGRTYLAAMEAQASDCAELRDLVERMAEAVGSNDIPAYRGRSLTFHAKIRHLCRNTAVNEVADRCDLYLRWFETIYDWAPEASAQSVAEHSDILGAFEAKSYSALSENIRAHMLRQREHIVRLFEKACIETGSVTERTRRVLSGAAEVHRN